MEVPKREQKKEFSIIKERGEGIPLNVKSAREAEEKDQNRDKLADERRREETGGHNSPGDEIDHSPKTRISKIEEETERSWGKSARGQERRSINRGGGSAGASGNPLH